MSSGRQTKSFEKEVGQGDHLRPLLTRITPLSHTPLSFSGRVLLRNTFFIDNTPSTNSKKATVHDNVGVAPAPLQLL